tara:strand:- start:290 stop:463 length:174 start_codon:yes stop_codon:yes gene_type:complete
MVSDKLEKLREDFEKVSVELEKLTQLKLKLMGAIEVLTQIEEESEDKTLDDKKEKNK